MNNRAKKYRGFFIKKENDGRYDIYLDDYTVAENFINCSSAMCWIDETQFD